MSGNELSMTISVRVGWKLIKHLHVYDETRHWSHKNDLHLASRSKIDFSFIDDALKPGGHCHAALSSHDISLISTALIPKCTSFLAITTHPHSYQMFSPWKVSILCVFGKDSRKLLSLQDQSVSTVGKRVSHSSGASEATVDVCIMCLCVCVCFPFLIFFYVLNYLLFYFFLQDAFVNVNRGLNGVFFRYR